jgi:hypothetical protein
MDIFDVKAGEKLIYIFLIISPALIGIVAVLLPFSADGEVDLKMLVAMLVCFAISLYFTIHYVLHKGQRKKTETFTLDFKKGEDSTESLQNPGGTQQNNGTQKKKAKR